MTVRMRERSKELIVRLVSTKEVNTYKGIWRHPARGTGEICDSLARGILERGGRIEYQAKLLGMTTSGGRVDEVTAEVGGEAVAYKPANTVSSIPIEFLLRYLMPQQSTSAETNARALDPLRRTVVLVYLFFDEEPRFPQAWLQVTCPSTRIGRITNYTAFNGDMVPKGKSALCCEYYCFGADPLLNVSQDQLVEMTSADLARFGLITRSKIFDQTRAEATGCRRIAEPGQLDEQNAPAHDGGSQSLPERVLRQQD
jgi:protoporphyrinogen oxidase